MMTPEQQSFWKKEDARNLAELERSAERLILAAEQMKPVIEKAIGGWENADRKTIGYLFAVGELETSIKLLREHRVLFAAANARSNQMQAHKKPGLQQGMDPSLIGKG